jgi:hypothetical protein
MNRITEHKLINYIKQIIKEDDDREKKLIQKFIDNYGDFIIDFKIDSNNITFIMRGEESYKYGKKVKSFMDKFHKIIGDDYNLSFVFESKFSAEVNYEKDGRYYYVTFSKLKPNGETFELEGMLVPFGTGRGIEYEFEPSDISDEEYWDENWEKIDEYILNNIPYEKTTKNKINEAVGVPENIIDSAINLYDYIFAYISSLRDIESKDEYKTQIIGNFRISDMNLIKINLKFELHKNKIDDFILIGMGQASESVINSMFQIEARINRDETDLEIDLATPNEFEDKELIDFLVKNKKNLIPIIAHELKHAYDTFKKNKSNLLKRVEYSVYSNSNFGGIKSLKEFLFNSYYIHNIENLVRPTEMAAQIQIDEITPKQFKEFFLRNQIYQTLKKIKEFSYEQLKNELMEEESSIESLLNHVGENYGTLEEKVDRILELFYINLTNWKNDKVIKYIYPMGVNNPLFPIFQTSEKDNYLDYFFKKSGKYENDYINFFRDEEKYQRNTATKMIKKLGRLYELTYKNIDEPMKPNPILAENKSIWDWDLYHQIKGTNSVITNKLNTTKDMLDENDLKKIIKRVIDDNNKKSPK